MAYSSDDSLENEPPFFFDGNARDHFESLAWYKVGGLHPVQLGDVIPKPSTCSSDAEKAPRYQILLKIKYSPFSLTWLAYDIREESVSVISSYDVRRPN